MDFGINAKHTSVQSICHDVGYYFDADTACLVVAQGRTMLIYVLDENSTDAAGGYYQAAQVTCDVVVSAVVVVKVAGSCDHLLVLERQTGRWCLCKLVLHPTDEDDTAVLDANVHVVARGQIERPAGRADTASVSHAARTDSTGTHVVVSLYVGSIAVFSIRPNGRAPPECAVASPLPLPTVEDEAVQVAWMMSRDFMGEIMLGVLLRRPLVPLDPPLTHFVTLCFPTARIVSTSSSSCAPGPWGIENVDECDVILPMPCGLLCVPGKDTIKIYSPQKGLESVVSVPGTACGLVTLTPTSFLASLGSGHVALCTVRASNVSDEGVKSRRQGTYFEVDVVVQRFEAALHTLVAHTLHDGRLWRLVGHSRTSFRVLSFDVSGSGDISLRNERLVCDWGPPTFVLALDSGAVCVAHPHTSSVARHVFGHTLDLNEDSANQLRGVARCFPLGDTHLLLSYTQSHESVVVSLLEDGEHGIGSVDGDKSSTVVDTGDSTISAYRSGGGATTQVTTKLCRVRDPNGCVRQADIDVLFSKITSSSNLQLHVTHAFAAAQFIVVVADRRYLAVLSSSRLEQPIFVSDLGEANFVADVSIGGADIRVVVCFENQTIVRAFDAGAGWKESASVDLGQLCATVLHTTSTAPTCASRQLLFCGLQGGACCVLSSDLQCVLLRVALGGTHPVALFCLEDRVLAVSGNHTRVLTAAGCRNDVHVDVAPCYVGDASSTLCSVARVGKQHYGVWRSESGGYNLSRLSLSPAAWLGHRLETPEVLSHFVSLSSFQAMDNDEMMLAVNEAATSWSFLCATTLRTLHTQTIPSISQSPVVVVGLQKKKSCGSSNETNCDVDDVMCLLADDLENRTSIVSVWRALRSGDSAPQAASSPPPVVLQCCHVSRYTSTFIERAVLTSHDFAVASLCLQTPDGIFSLPVAEAVTTVSATKCTVAGRAVLTKCGRFALTSKGLHELGAGGDLVRCVVTVPDGRSVAMEEVVDVAAAAAGDSFGIVTRDGRWVVVPPPASGACKLDSPVTDLVVGSGATLTDDECYIIVTAHGGTFKWETKTNNTVPHSSGGERPNGGAASSCTPPPSLCLIDK